MMKAGYATREYIHDWIIPTKFLCKMRLNGIFYLKTSNITSGWFNLKVATQHLHRMPACPKRANNPIAYRVNGNGRWYKSFY